MRPRASLSLDFDNEWSYQKIHGDAGWEALPSYLDRLVPRVLDLLSSRGQRMTAFIVGQDAALDRNREPIAALAAAGHEIANHSFRHEPWLHRYSETELHDELARAEDAIGAVTGVRTTGFRGPGYSLSSATLRVLADRGYRYDASTLPTFIGPIARAYYFRSTDLSAEQRQERAYLYGTWRDGLRPVRPYRIAVGGDDGGAPRTLVELPVTTMPLVRVPIHVSYLLMLSKRSPAAARVYFAGALALCRASGIGPSILLHPLDLLSGEDVPSLRFFPGMAIPGAVKVERVAGYLDQLRARFDVVPVGEHAASLAAEPLPVREPVFP